VGGTSVRLNQVILDTGLLHLIEKLLGLLSVNRLARTSLFSLSNAGEEGLKLRAETKDGQFAARDGTAEAIQIGSRVDDLGEDEVCRARSEIGVPEETDVVVGEAGWGTWVDPRQGVYVDPPWGIPAASAIQETSDATIVFPTPTGPVMKMVGTLRDRPHPSPPPRFRKR
jgi:hypothetical protein